MGKFLKVDACEMIPHTAQRTSSINRPTFGRFGTYKNISNNGPDPTRPGNFMTRTNSTWPDPICERTGPCPTLIEMILKRRLRVVFSVPSSAALCARDVCCSAGPHIVAPPSGSSTYYLDTTDLWHRPVPCWTLTIWKWIAATERRNDYMITTIILMMIII